MPKLPTVWPITPHTAAKHSIFRRHLEAWFPKLAWAGRLLIVDGFAGPGEYLGGEPGSPVIAVEVARGHKSDLSKCSISFVFVEEDEPRYEHLSQQVGNLDLPPNISISLKLSSFRDAATGLLSDLESQWSVPPSFVMIDPFGFEGVPLGIIERFSRLPRCEVFVSFMYDSVTRWLGDERNESNFDELFGTEAWRAARQMDDPGERKAYLLNLYVSQLQSHGWKFVRTFEMRDAGNRTEYFLAFGSNHIEGLKVVKEAMWKVDPTGRYVFSDATDRRQLTLFSPEPNYDLLRRLIRERFEFSSSFTIEQLEEFVVVETAFRETHYKGQILRPMEMAGELLVLQGGTRTRRGVYPAGTTMRLLS